MRASFFTCLFTLMAAASTQPAKALPSVEASQEFAQEFRHLQLVAKVAERSGEQNQLLKALRNIRDLQIRMDVIDSALNTSRRIVNLNGISDDRLLIASDWRELARLSRQVGNLAQAVSGAKKAVLILRTTGDREHTGAATLELLDLLLASQRYVEFKPQSESALQFFQAADDRTGQAMVQYRQGECLIAQGRAPDALSVLHLALRSRDAIQDDGKTALILFALARANAEVAQWSAASAAMREALQLAPKAPTSSPELFGLRSRIDEGLGNLVSALSYERQATHVKDSLSEVHRSDHLARVQALYEVRSKEKDLAELQQKNRAQAISLGQERTKGRISLLLCGALTVLLLTLLLRKPWLDSQAKRARIKSRVIQAQAKDLESKYTELEQQRLRLSQALVGHENRTLDGSRDLLNSGSATNLFELLITGEMHASGDQASAALIRLRSSARVLAMVQENREKTGHQDRVLLKAHLLSVAEALFRERGLSEKMRLELVVAKAELPLDQLLPLSLLFHELLRMTLDHSGAEDAPALITASLGDLGEHRCELLYTDPTGAVSAAGLSTSTPSGAQVLALAERLNGSIRLLKSEGTTFQLTFESRSRTAMRMAS